MAAISPSTFQQPPISYREAEIAGALAGDVMFFLRHRDRHHRVRRATFGEIQLVQIIERRLHEPTPGCEVIVLVKRIDDTHRRRAVVEAHGIDLDAITEAEAASLFEAVVTRGCTSIQGGRA